MKPRKSVLMLIFALTLLILVVVSISSCGKGLFGPEPFKCAEEEWTYPEDSLRAPIDSGTVRVDTNRVVSCKNV